MVKTIHFSDYPDFLPNLTPKNIFQSGSFGGTYWRPIHSAVTGKSYQNKHMKYAWAKRIPQHKMVVPFDEYDKTVNRYGVKVGTTLEFWEHQHWINPSHPYGWVQWYCDFYDGKRCADDERQIKRWIQTAGPNSRFRKQLINRIHKAHARYDDESISPKIRQTLQHWAYTLTSTDCN